MITALKSIIDRTTIYRLVLYYLLALLGAAIILGWFGIVPYAPGAVLLSTIVLLGAAWLSNELLARFFGAVTNFESAIITALILALIFPPIALTGIGGVAVLVVIAVVAMASKYLLSVGKKHIFNPAAFAIVFSAFTLGIPATWWVAGSIKLLPLLIFGGVLVVYKLRRFDLVFAFGGTALIAVSLSPLSPLVAIQETLLHSAFFFLAFVMLTEPLTMPPTRKLRIIYGIIVGALFSPIAHIGSFYFTPEIGLLVGNLFSYIVSPKGRYALTLVERRKLARGIYEFVFRPDKHLNFAAGQYLEWTLGQVPFDNRGNRRYFTVASSPHEENVRLGVRFYDAPSAFKRTLAALPKEGVIYGASLAGDFTLPKHTKRKLAFIAGGVGVTPFASMARHLIDSGESRDAILLYSSRVAEEIAYQDVFARASRQGLTTVYVLIDTVPLLPGIRKGPIDAALITREIPDYRERLFYLSGPPGMISAMRDSLRGLGVSRFSIKTDYFPGLA